MVARADTWPSVGSGRQRRIETDKFHPSVIYLKTKQTQPQRFQRAVSKRDSQKPRCQLARGTILRHGSSRALTQQSSPQHHGLHPRADPRGQNGPCPASVRAAPRLSTPGSHPPVGRGHLRERSAHRFDRVQHHSGASRESGRRMGLDVSEGHTRGSKIITGGRRRLMPWSSPADTTRCLSSRQSLASPSTTPSSPGESSIRIIIRRPRSSETRCVK